MLSTVAIALLLLVHVPPLLGETLAVEPAHTYVAPPRTGEALTVTAEVVEEHPLTLVVNVNVAEPAATPVTTPEFVTVATLVLLEVHVPPVVGDNVVV